jgi:methylglutaconyl-CoA hydratase
MPIVAGQMGLTPTGWTVKKGHALLRVRDVDLSYSELQSTGFSEKLLLAETLSSVPSITDAEVEWNVCRIQANFIRGGLLLVISIHHSVMDGYGITKVIEALAHNCRVADDSKSSFEPVTYDRSQLSNCEGEGDITKLQAYSVVGTPALRSVSKNVITTSFRLFMPALKSLKAAASPANGWVTTHDALNALCWRAHARGRYKAKYITEEDIARFAFPVEFRKLLHDPLLPEYIGNAVLMTKVELPVKILLGPDGLSIAAATIRKGIHDIDAAYVNNFLAVVKSLENPRQLRINLMLDNPRTGFGSTSYKSFAHSTLDWEPVLGKYERLRLPHGVLGEGMSIILPVLSDGSWEVTVTLEEELVKLFRADEEWTTFCT